MEKVADDAVESICLLSLRQVTALREHHKVSVGNLLLQNECGVHSNHAIFATPDEKGGLLHLIECGGRKLRLLRRKSTLLDRLGPPPENGCIASAHLQTCWREWLRPTY
jgi:hypothetical protein